MGVSVVREHRSLNQTEVMQDQLPTSRGAASGNVLLVLGDILLLSCAELSILEATHESLIPLEEEEEEEEEGAEEATAMELEQRSNLLDQVVNLARDLGRSHRLRGKCKWSMYPHCTLTVPSLCLCRRCCC